MNRMRFLVWLVLFFSFFVTKANAAAFQFYELGTPIIATAGVGQAAIANDASTSYFNPAGMSKLSSTEFMVGSELISPQTSFSKNSATTITGDSGGGNAGMLTPGIGLYYVYRHTPKVKLGVSLTSPYGGMLTYDNGWVGRYIVQSSEFYTLNLNPSLSYQVNDSVALGAGIAIEYANLHQTVALPLPAKPVVDGQATVKVANTAGGYNLGVLWLPTPKTRVGLAYRSKITHNLSGNTSFVGIAATPVTTTRMVMPQNVILSLVQDVSKQFSLLGELGWANWSTMRNSITYIAGYTASTPLHWSNTYRVGIGGQYHASQALTWQGGVSYDSSPTKTSMRLPDLPMDRQYRLGVGLLYSIMRGAKIGLSYEYLNLGSANINNTSSNGVLSGGYGGNHANVLQASINVDC